MPRRRNESSSRRRARSRVRSCVLDARNTGARALGSGLAEGLAVVVLALLVGGRGVAVAHAQAQGLEDHGDRLAVARPVVRSTPSPPSETASTWAPVRPSGRRSFSSVDMGVTASPARRRAPRAPPPARSPGRSDRRASADLHHLPLRRRAAPSARRPWCCAPRVALQVPLEPGADVGRPASRRRTRSRSPRKSASSARSSIACTRRETRPRPSGASTVAIASQRAQRQSSLKVRAMLHERAPRALAGGEAAAGEAGVQNNYAPPMRPLSAAECRPKSSALRSMPDHHPFDAPEIPVGGDVAPARPPRRSPRSPPPGRRRSPAPARRPGQQMRRRRRHQPAHQIQAVGAAVEGQRRLVPHLGRQAGDVAARGM